ncbi:plasmid recombination protein [Anabaena minutissima FACHB-250]|nr:plasmid recombination protein [Anabaena minutissima FACHB-250]
MPLAVCRIQKIKSWGLLGGNEAHTARARNTPNANPAVTNVTLYGSYDNANLVTLVKDKIGLQTIRSNAVLAVEMLLSASADYFHPEGLFEAETYDKQRLDDFAQATVTWLCSAWGDRLLKAELHLDEITPHVHAYIVPLDEQGKLNCRALFGTREKLSQLQDSFADAVAHLGISRGIKSSAATYTSVKKYYAAVSRDSEILDLESYLPKPRIHEASESYRERVIEALSPKLELINYQLSDRTRLLRQKAELEETASRSEKLRANLEKELQALRQDIKLLKDLPLEVVADELGLNQDKRNQWLSTHHIITTSNSSFHDDLHNSIGKGALELVIQVNQCTFDDAVVWLRDCFGEEGMLAAVTHHARRQALNIAQQIPPSIFVAPTPDHHRWVEIERYLTRDRSLPPKFVDTLYKRGLIYADITGKAVFLARSLASKVTGAYLHPPGATNDTFSFCTASKGRLMSTPGWFHLSLGGDLGNPIKMAMLVSTPIEAMSLAVLNAPHKQRTLYLVSDSEHAPAPVEFLQNVPKVIVAMPKVATMALQKTLSHAKQLEPNTSWNQQLQQQCQGGISYVTLG